MKATEMFVQRNAEIVAMYLDGHSYREVGEAFGLTRQRIEQIVARSTNERHRTNARREAYDLKIREAFDRVMNSESSINKEAEEIGIQPDSLRWNFRRKGLLLPKREVKLHGTRHRYNMGCRCDACREAVRLHQRSLKGREPREHGTVSAYTNYGCRCDACRKAGSKHNARYRERRLQRAKRVLHGVPTS